MTDMQKLFTDQERLRRWFHIEYLAIEAQQPPATARHVLVRMYRTGPPTPAEVLAREEVTGHDVAAFVDCVQEKLPPDLARHVHWGLTSSDVVDTALFWTLRDALHLVLGKALPERVAQRLRITLASVSVGKLSGAVGTYGNLDPNVEQHVCRRLRLLPVPSTQVIGRDRIAQVVFDVAMVAPRARRWVGVALEDVALWHERDISHSSVERIMLADVFDCLWEKVTGEVPIQT